MSKQPQQQQQEQEEDALKTYCIDLTERAAAGRLDPVVGREAETRTVVQTLMRKSKNNPVLIGQPVRRRARNILLLIFWRIFIFLTISACRERASRRWWRSWRSALSTATCPSR